MNEAEILSSPLFIEGVNTQNYMINLLRNPESKRIEKENKDIDNWFKPNPKCCLNFFEYQNDIVTSSAGNNDIYVIKYKKSNTEKDKRFILKLYYNFVENVNNYKFYSKNFWSNFLEFYCLIKTNKILEKKQSPNFVKMEYYGNCNFNEFRQFTGASEQSYLYN